MEQINSALLSACKKLFDEEISPELTLADPKFGDYASNVAMRLASKLGRNPSQLAEEICNELAGSEQFSCQPAGPGFINFRLNAKYWTEELHRALEAGDAFGKNQLFKSKTVVSEYSDPNPFKMLHAGHLYTSVVGDAISNLFENAGAKVYRVNFGGDVGLHAAKTVWSIINKLGGENPEKLAKIPAENRAQWMAEEYVLGSLAYGDDKRIDSEIEELNKRIYQIHNQSDHDTPLAKIYWTIREWSYEYLKDFYKRIGSHFDKFYAESETAALGLVMVKEGIKNKIFKESEGAIVFEGEEHGLHTRVFINSQGLPTYETKDLGLMHAKKRDYNPDISLVITGNEQAEYMKVVLKAMHKIDASLATRTRHITHGLVKLKDGQKMSSRKGNILGADEVLEIAGKTNQEVNKKNQPEVVLGAVKYSFIKQRIGADIIFDPVESVNLHGNSGPYIQYAHARASSILSKSNKQSGSEQLLVGDELELAKKILAFEGVLLKAVEEMLPSQVCTYLYELAQVFNRFYEHNRVLDNERETTRLELVKAYRQAIKNGLNILGIKAPDKLE